jgi:hypothetical protein
MVKIVVPLLMIVKSEDQPVELLTPADRRGSAQYIHTTQRTDSNKLLVTADLPLAQ